MLISLDRLEQKIVALPGRVAETEAALRSIIAPVVVGREIVREEVQEHYDIIHDGWVSRLRVTMLKQ